MGKTKTLTPETMIGVFDSGVGGLSVLAKLRERAPHADIIYFGDIAHAPYGTRPLSEIQSLTSSAVKLLLDQGAEDIISACNSVSMFIPEIKFVLPKGAPHSLTEMTRPTMRGLLRDFRGKNIVFFATPATIASGIYQERCAEEGILATYIAIPELAGAIESGAPQSTLSKIIAEAVSFLPSHSQIISLSCTHYPFVQDIFAQEIARTGLNVTIFDPADAVAEDVCAVSILTGNGTTHFILSRDSEVFRNKVAQLYFNKTTFELDSPRSLPRGLLVGKFENPRFSR